MRAVVSLALLLAAYGWFLRGALPSAWRRRVSPAGLRIIRSIAVFAVPSLIVLVLLGRLTALGHIPREFVAWAGAPDVGDRLLVDVALGLGLGTLVGGVWAGLRRRRGKAPAMFGDFSAVLPRHRGEAGMAVATALTAAVTEELYFRLALPLVIGTLSGSAALGFAVATLLFAGAHRYQGWRGVVATGLVGALLAAVYLASGALWLAIVAHATINLNALLLRPWIGGQLRR